MQFVFCEFFLFSLKEKNIKMAMVKSSDFCESFEKLKSESVEESLKKGEDATQLLTERVLKDFILFSSTKRRPLLQKDFNNGPKFECFTTENTPKKPRTQRSPKPYTKLLMPMVKLQLFYQSLKLMEISTMILSLNVS